MRRCTPHKETSHGIFLSHSALPFGVSPGKTGSFTWKDIAAKGRWGCRVEFQPGLWSSCRAFTGARWLLRCGTCIGVDGGDDHNWGMVGKTTVSAKLLCLQKDIVVTHFSSVWESCHNQLMGNEARLRHTGFEVFSVPGHLRCYIGAIFLCNSVLRTFHAQIFQTNQRNQWVFGIVRDKIQKALHLYLSHPIYFRCLLPNR